MADPHHPDPPGTAADAPPSPGVTELDPVQPLTPPAQLGGPDSPIRKVTRQVAFDGAWDPDRAGKVSALFDGMAADWDQPQRFAPERWAPLHDALDRGDVPEGLVVELGSGTGLGTRVLSRRGRTPVAAVDISAAMLAHAPSALAPRILGDASALPLRNGSVDVAVMVNALLFPAEMDRVLAPGGRLVWVNTVGEQTPIHLSATDVVAALPGQWHAVASRAGTGTWAVVGRAREQALHGR